MRQQAFPASWLNNRPEQLDCTVYLVSSLLYNAHRPKLNQDFIIVLGSGLIGNRVPPLLAGRLERAIALYHKQGRVHAPPRFVVSGGQGSDERIAEAEAMRRYLRERSIPDEHIRLYPRIYRRACAA